MPKTAWECKCVKDGKSVIRPASAAKCFICKEEAPWKNEPERVY